MSDTDQNTVSDLADLKALTGGETAAPAAEAEAEAPVVKAPPPAVRPGGERSRGVVKAAKTTPSPLADGPRARVDENTGSSCA